MQNRLLLLPLTIFGAFLVGCATGPQYRYTRQADSASIRFDQTPSSVLVFINHIDGYVTPTALRLGYKGDRDEVYVSPGRHMLDVFIYYKTESDNNGSLGYYMLQGGGNINAVFLANREYRIAASVVGNTTFDVILWDETKEGERRVNVGQWKFRGYLDYQSNQ